MHACLSVDEIVRLVARELVASGGEATAVALACCCKCLEDSVLDVLWVTQNRLLKLLKSFSGDVWNNDKCTVSTPTTCFSLSLLNGSIRKSFRRLPTTIEWARFRKYARRMRELREFDTQGALSEVLPALQLHAINEPLLPNLNSLDLWSVNGPFVPFIPLVLPPRVTSVLLAFLSDVPRATVASVVSTVPTLCSKLQRISLYALPTDPIVTAAVSGMVLATNRNTLQQFRINSPLTEEASDVLYKLPDLRDLSVSVEGETSLPSASLPNLTNLVIECEKEGNWLRLFHGATLGKLESVMIYPKSEEIGDFLGAFERVALSSSIQNTLSTFHVRSPCSWNPNYSSLLPFTQLVDLVIGFSCDGGCSSRVDDDIVISLSRAMPKLTSLQLGDDPCEELMTGVTAKGLTALALHCPKLSILRIHFQVASLSAPPASPGISHNTEPTGSWTDCALTDLIVGDMVVPEESVSMVALTLLRIFPRIGYIEFFDEGWGKVMDVICLSKRIVDCSSKQHPLTEVTSLTPL